jgi:hypothetical protein
MGCACGGLSSAITRDVTRLMAPSTGAQPPRWLTPEFVWHYAVRPHAAIGRPSCPAHPPLALAHLQVITRALVFLYTTARHATHQLSPAGRPSLLRGVQPGLWPQYQVDLSDPQWRSFRHALPALCAAALLSALTARLVRAWLGRKGLLGHSHGSLTTLPRLYATACSRAARLVSRL